MYKNNGIITLTLLTFISSTQLVSGIFPSKETVETIDGRIADRQRMVGELSLVLDSPRSKQKRGHFDFRADAQAKIANLQGLIQQDQAIRQELFQENLKRAKKLHNGKLNWKSKKRCPIRW